MEMPIGYLVTTGLMAAFALSAMTGHHPRESSRFRLSYIGGLPFNWPLAAAVVLVASTALAIAQNGMDSPVLWIGLAFAVIAAVGLVVVRRRAQGTGPAVERALDQGLGAAWRDRVDPEVVGRLRRRPSLAHVLFAPVSFRRHGVERVANIRYGPAHRGNLLDLYRCRSNPSSGPTLIYLHPGAFVFGSKRLGARHLFCRLASRGWVCVSANYRLRSAGFPDPLIDVKNVIAWIREHGHEYGADPSLVFVAGSSAGAHLASMAALTPNDPVFQPGFEGTDTSVAGAISLYGYYGPVTSGEQPSSPLAYLKTTAPPWFVAHGDQDSLVIPEDARRFVEELRRTSSNPVVYAELPGAQHGFDLFRSRRLETVVDAIEAFAASVSSARPDRSVPTDVTSGVPSPGIAMRRDEVARDVT
jgi:acetyl esterase/lipase